MDRFGEELRFAVGLVRQAGALVRESYGRVQTVTAKGRRDVVTDVDHRSEALLVGGITRRYPDDAILAEEAGLGGKAGGPRTWMVDPLDGTINYANGIPYFCVSVGLVVDGQPVVGAVLDPLRDDLYAASADGPARLNDRVVRASRKAALADFVVSLTVLGNSRAGVPRVTEAIRINRRMGSAALSLASVAAGRFDAFIQNGGLSRWDVAAAGFIAERGGARVTSLAGGPWWDPGQAGPLLNIVAAPPVHHPAILDLVAAAGIAVDATR